MQKFFVEALAEGMIPHWQIYPGFPVRDTLGMGEGIKAGFFMVCTYAAFAWTAKAHGGCCNKFTALKTTA